MKKFVSILLVAMMLIAMLPATVFAADTATSSMSFASTAQRVSQDNDSQVWKNEGIIFTNNKASSGSNVGNYSNPVRIYQGSQVTIEHEAGLISQIVFESDGTAKYKTALENSLKGAGVTYTNSSNNYTVNFTPAVESFTFSATAQARFKTLKVTYEIADEGACTHTGYETYEGDDAVAATCTATGLTATVYCSNCNEPVVGQQVEAMLPHNVVDGACSVCGAEAYMLVTDLSELHVGTQIVIVGAEYNTTISTTQSSNNRPEAAVTKAEDKSYVSFGADAQILTIEAGAEVGTYAFNTGSGYLYAAGGGNYLRTKAELDAAGSWTIEIAEDGIATIKAVAELEQNWLRYNDNNKIFSCYKADSTQKDIALYKLPVAEEPGDECDHLGYETYEGDDYVAPTCTTTGLTATIYCSNCDAVVKEQEELPISHEGFDTYTEDYIPATCTQDGETGITYCSNCDEIVSENEVIPALGHNYEGGVCTNCGDKVEVKSEATYVFANYTAGTQYATNEEHVLDDVVTMYTTESHFTSELRIYSSSSHNGFAVIKSKLPIKAITVNAGNKADTLVVYGSTDDGATWVEVTEIAVTSTSYANYTASLVSNPYSCLKLDVKGANQVRLKNMTLEFVTTSAGDCTHELTETISGTAATCTTEGKEDTLSCLCGQNVQEGAVIPALGHNYEDDFCARCSSINPEAAKKAESIDGMPQAGDVVIFYHPNGKVAMGAAANNDRMSAVAVTKADGMIPYSETATAVMNVEQVGEYFRFEMNGLYLTSGTTGNTLCFAALPAEGATDYSLWKVTADSSYGVFICSVNATYNGTAYNQTIEYYNNQFYPYGFDGTNYITSYRIQIGLVSRIELPPVVEMDGVQYTSFEEAYAYDPDTTIKLLVDFEEINVTGDLYLDLNGHTVGSVTANAVFAGDSTATTAAAGTGKLTTESEVIVDNTIGDVRYIALKGDDGAYTFHAMELKLEAVTLRTNKAGIYYKASMACDEILAAQIESYGVAVSVVGMPTAKFETEANTVATKMYGAPEGTFTSGSITNIFRDGLSAEKNAARGEMAIYANPYIKLYDETVLMGRNATSRSMKDVMTYLNDNFATLEVEDQENVKNFYAQWADSMAAWNLANLAAAILPNEE